MRADRNPSARSGFALLITITLVAFLVLILVGLASLTRVETQVAANSQQLASARQNALSALNLAIGRLQGAAGPDQRVTATADILPGTHPSKKNWTGVWDANSPTPTWLVSTDDPSNAPDPTTEAPVQTDIDAGDAVRLVGANSADTTVPGDGNEIIVPLQPIRSDSVPGLDGAQTVGHLGYWVADEGVKARVNLADPLAPSPDFSPTIDEQRLRQTLAPRVGAERLTLDATSGTRLGDAGYPALGADATAAGFRANLSKLIADRQLPIVLDTLADTTVATFARERFHDITTHSFGVLADARLGGLKKDLTVGFRSGAPRPSGPLFEIPSGSTIPTNTHVPTWEILRSYARLADAIGTGDSIAPRRITATGMGVMPVVAQYQLFHHVTVDDTTSPPTAPRTVRLRQLLFPAVVLWNPYNVTLRGDTYRARIQFNQSVGSRTQAGLQLDNPGEIVVRSSQLNGSDDISFMLDVPDIPPGEAVIFTPRDNQDFTVTTTEQRVLTPGWRTHFYHGLMLNPSAGGPSEHTLAVGQTINRVLLALYGVGNNAFDLALGANFDLQNTGAQAVRGLNAFFIREAGYGGTYAGFIPPPNPSGSAPAQAWVIGSVDGTPVGQAPFNPVAGWFARMRFATTASPATQPGIQWLGHYNPAAPFIGRTAVDRQIPGGGGNYNNIPQMARTTVGNSGAFVIPSPNLINAYVGESASFGPTRTVLFELPRSSTVLSSIGALQHAQLHAGGGDNFIISNTPGYAASATPAYVIGNSLADPRVYPGDDSASPDPVGMSSYPNINSNFRTVGSDPSSPYFPVHFDLSYLINRTLWDGYFFSTVPETGDPVPANPRLVLHGDPAPARLRDHDEAAAGLLVAGAFNVNSTSVEAWRAVLASTRGIPVRDRSGGLVSPAGSGDDRREIPYSRFAFPESGLLDANAGGSPLGVDAAAYAGFRSLTNNQIDALATRIVEEIKNRAADGAAGPFRSLSAFINRNPSATAGNIPHRLSGALQAALDDPAVGINRRLVAPIQPDLALNGLSTPGAPTTSTGLDVHGLYRDTAIGPAARGLPGYLTQADLLQLLGPVLAPRSDTFRIRAYGDIQNPVTGTVEGRAWCEAIVQRLPDYINPDADASEDYPPTATENQTFGRRFEIVSFRWLLPEDI